MNSNTSSTSSNLTITNWTSGLFSPVHRQAWVIWIAMIAATVVFGVVANLILLLASATTREIRKKSSTPLILHCTILDLYMSVVVPVNNTLGFLGPSWNVHLPRNFCRFFGLWFYSAYGLHAWAACFVAFQRLVATLVPHSYAKFTTRKATATMLILPWIVVALINLFNVLEIGSKTATSKFAGGCTTVPAGVGGDVMLYHAFSLYLPSALMGAMYFFLLMKTAYELTIKSREPELVEATKHTTVWIIKRRFQISKMLCVSFLWFCLSMYPLPIAIAYFPKMFNENIWVHLTVRYLVASYSCLNPVS
jgi:hypothetical protein